MCKLPVYLLVATLLLLAVDGNHSSCPQELIREACAHVLSSLPHDFPKLFNTTLLIPYLKKNPKACSLFIQAADCAILATGDLRVCHREHMKIRMFSKVIIKTAKCDGVKC